jgi:hypothetical protein
VLSSSRGRLEWPQHLEAGRPDVFSKKENSTLLAESRSRAPVIGLLKITRRLLGEKSFFVIEGRLLTWFEQASAKRERLSKVVLATVVTLFPLHMACAQDLTPRAYTITPVHSNAITLTYSFNSGEILVGESIPITDFRATLNIPVLSYYHSLSFFGRSANFVASIPYGTGDFQGKVSSVEHSVYRSGLMDATFRFSVNLVGGQAMPLDEMKKWRQKTLLGVSIKVIAPTGQYDPTKLVNLSGNRWAFKPEFGYSRRRGHVVLDMYGGMWLFTTNPEFYSHNASFPGTRTMSQKPMASFEGHLSYDVRPLFWVSLDGNFWYGGRTTFNGIENPQTLQKNSRVGVTASLPLRKRHTLKFSYSRGAYVTIGGAFQNISVAWQYSWVGRPD